MTVLKKPFRLRRAFLLAGVLRHAGVTYEFGIGATDGIDRSACCFRIEVYHPGFPGDPDCYGAINVGDAVYDIEYIFSGGPRPRIWIGDKDDFRV